jgi:hypothetical protein
MILDRRRASKLPEFKDFGSETAPTARGMSSALGLAKCHSARDPMDQGLSAARVHRTVGDDDESARLAGSGRLRAPRIVPTGYEAASPSEVVRSTRLPRNLARMPRARHCRTSSKGETRAADAVAREAVDTLVVPAILVLFALRRRRDAPGSAARLRADRFRSRRLSRVAPGRSHPQKERGKRIFHHEKNADQRNSA